MARTQNETSDRITETSAGAPKTLPAEGRPKPAETRPSPHRWRKLALGVGAVGGLAVGGYLLKPAMETALNTVSTDDAYVNGHVTGPHAGAVLRPLAPPPTGATDPTLSPASGARRE
jgi:hypothetical protein